MEGKLGGAGGGSNGGGVWMGVGVWKVGEEVVRPKDLDLDWGWRCKKSWWGERLWMSLGTIRDLPLVFLW